MKETMVTDTVPDEQPPPRPRWVKVSALVASAVAALLIVLALAGGHGPGRHLPGGDDPGGHTPPVDHAP